MDETFDYIRRIIPATETIFLVPSSSGGGGTPTIAWNPADKGAPLTLSNSNLTATISGADNSWNFTRTDTGYSSGARYFEIKIVSSTGGAAAGSCIIAGIADLTTNAATAIFVGGFPNSAGTRYDFTSVNGTFVEDVNTSFGGSEAANDVLMFAVDITNKKVWRGKNGTWLGSVTPVVGDTTQWAHWTGALTVYAALSINEDGAANSATLQAIASSLSFSPPSGFSPWDPV